MSEATAVSTSGACDGAVSSSTHMTTTVQLLRHQCVDLTKLHLAVCESLDGAIGKIERDIEVITNSGAVTTLKAVRLASDMEQISGCLKQLHKTVSELQAPPADSEVNRGTESEDVTSDVQENVSANNSIGDMPSSESTSILTSQIISLQEKLIQIENKTNQHTTDMAAIETLKGKVKLLEKVELEGGNKIVAMSDSIRTVNEHLNRLESDQMLYEDRLVSLTTTTNKLTYLRDQLNKLHANGSSRQELSKSIESSRDEMDAIKHQVCELQTHISQNEGAANIIQALSAHGDELTIRPSFVAQVLNNGNQAVKPQNRVHFEHVVSNVWDSYDETVSTFRAPVNGTYLFSVSVNSNDPGILTLAIMHNGQQVASCCGTTKDAQTSTTVVLSLDLMDAVWVEGTSQTSEEGIELGAGFSSFTGCRLF